MKSVKDYDTLISTQDVDERNKIVEELYRSGKEYFYTDKDKEGFYKIAYNK